MSSERAIHVDSREDLIYLLAEAAEIEHNLMCCYLFAAFSLKDESDGLEAAQAAELRSWRRAIVDVAIEEMSHLTLVANLTLAIGGSPHFGRPNFPVASGYHPSGVILELHRLDRATLDHFIYLERPEGVEAPDGAAFPIATRIMCATWALAASCPARKTMRRSDISTAASAAPFRLCASQRRGRSVRRRPRPAGRP